MLASDVQAKKANSSITDTFFSSFTSSKAVQWSNKPEEITLTESGRTIDFKLLQSKNAYSPISVILSPSITSVRYFRDVTVYIYFGKVSASGESTAAYGCYVV